MSLETVSSSLSETGDNRQLQVTTLQPSVVVKLEALFAFSGAVFRYFLQALSTCQPFKTLCVDILIKI